MAQSIPGHELELEAEAIREAQRAVIPLDTKDPSYKLWRTLRTLDDDPKREAGIINSQKLHENRESGELWRADMNAQHLATEPKATQGAVAQFTVNEMSHIS